MDLEGWLNKSFGITGKSGDEVQFPCPKCKHSSFFFNIKKQIGFCHRATCNYKPRIKDLNRHTRTQFGNAVYEQIDDNPNNVPRVHEIVLPEADLLVTKVDGELHTKYANAVLEVDNRGVTPEDQFRFKLAFNGIRVYIPVYYQGKLVNYVGRRAWWKDEELERAGVPKYEYCTGAKTNDFIFNWDEMKLRDKLVLVENSFNGIWLMNKCNGTTNFGSSLSKVQIELIRLSRVKSVVFLWDEGAEKRASVACASLQKLGIPAAFLKITRQPDNHSAEQLTAWVQGAHELARLGHTQVNT
jgi:hypothetical protein